MTAGVSPDALNAATRSFYKEMKGHAVRQRVSQIVRYSIVVLVFIGEYVNF
jgi:hypothetical protein